MATAAETGATGPDAAGCTACSPDTSGEEEIGSKANEARLDARSLEVENAANQNGEVNRERASVNSTIADSPIVRVRSSTESRVSTVGANDAGDRDVAVDRPREAGNTNDNRDSQADAGPITNDIAIANSPNSDGNSEDESDGNQASEVTSGKRTGKDRTVFDTVARVDDRSAVSGSRVNGVTTTTSEASTNGTVSRAKNSTTVGARTLDRDDAVNRGDSNSSPADSAVGKRGRSGATTARSEGGPTSAASETASVHRPAGNETRM
ncbi:hypothetical protein [Natrialbaceae archaeon AArc-T1-2]|uniref:hypothetical protein n=1 Tax=Natrialbaceae archaeon AArc-T1-2 TaxID=3053904 RepID=UPI00255AC260|nr:hypothetical protein [Natrialbaceae archaeon AArc-T1-2]WIV65996.1 hypothetical protein QQ977_09840 [Natrialbaceae archaeon AArc-T1-2]